MRYLTTALAVLAFSTFGCGLGSETYNVEEVSPNGTYKVRVHVTVEKSHTDMFGAFTEKGRIQFLKGESTVDDYHWNRRESLESTFIDDNPSIKWLADDVLRMGDHIENRQPKAKVTLVNNSRELLKYVKFACDSRLEQFVIFEVEPGKSKEVSACYSDRRLNTGPVPEIYFTGKMESGNEVFRMVTAQAVTESAWRFSFAVPVISEEISQK